MTTPDKRTAKRGAKPTIARSLGIFFGQLTRAVREPVDSEQRTEIGRSSKTKTVRDADGKQVILRRTTIDEIVERPETETRRSEEAR